MAAVWGGVVSFLVGKEGRIHPPPAKKDACNKQACRLQRRWGSSAAAASAGRTTRVRSGRARTSSCWRAAAGHPTTPTRSCPAATAPRTCTSTCSLAAASSRASARATTRTAPASCRTDAPCAETAPSGKPTVSYTSRPAAPDLQKLRNLQNLRLIVRLSY